MKLYAFLFLLCFVVLRGRAQTDDSVLLRINDEIITRAEFENAYGKHYPAAAYSKKHISQFLTTFIDDRLKLAEAKRQFGNKVGLSTGDSEKKLIDFWLSSDVFNMLIEDTPSVYEEERWRVVQIFKHLPQHITHEELLKVEKTMMSLYEEILNNPQVEFQAYVENHSDDKRESEIGLHEMPLEFEQMLLSMQEGEVSKPFLTPEGIHIIKVLNKKKALPHDWLKRAAKKTARLSSSASGKLIEMCNFVPNPESIQQLLSTRYTDQYLFTINGVAYTVKEFLRFSESSSKSLNLQLGEFITKSLMDYQTDQSGNNCWRVAQAMQEETDDNLLSAITWQEVGQKARNDRAGLTAYFSVYKKLYRLEQSRFRGIVLYARDKQVIKAAKKIVKKKPVAQWADIIRNAFNAEGALKVEVEQGLFAIGDNPFVDELAFKHGQADPLSSYPFTALIGKKIKKPERYEDVQDEVISDYEEFLERRWIERLRSIYQVEINEEVLKTVNNH